MLLINPTVSPPAGAGPLSTTVPVTICPEATLLGLIVTLVSTGGFTVNPAIMAALPAAEAVMFTFPPDAVGNVLTLNVPLDCPAAITNVAGTVARVVSLLTTLIVDPPAGAGPLRITMPRDPVPPVTAPGLNVRATIEGGTTVRLAEIFKLAPELAETVAVVCAATAVVVAVNEADVLPAGTVTPAGTTTVGSELESETKTPPPGAVRLTVTVPVDVEPPITVAGMKLTRTTGGGSTVSP